MSLLLAAPYTGTAANAASVTAASTAAGTQAHVGAVAAAESFAAASAVAGVQTYVGVVDSAASSTTTGSPYGLSAGGDYGASKRRYVRKIGNRLVTFSTARAAVAAGDGPMEMAATVSADEDAADEVVKKVNVATVKNLATIYAAEDRVMELFRLAQYEHIMLLVDEWQREEEDVELMLLCS